MNVQAYRAIRSYLWNSARLDIATARLAKATSTLISIGLVCGGSFTVGRYKVAIIAGEPHIEILPMPNVEQLSLPLLQPEHEQPSLFTS